MGKFLKFTLFNLFAISCAWAPEKEVCRFVISDRDRGVEFKGAIFREDLIADATSAAAAALDRKFGRVTRIKFDTEIPAEKRLTVLCTLLTASGAGVAGVKHDVDLTHFNFSSAVRYWACHYVDREFVGIQIAAVKLIDAGPKSILPVKFEAVAGLPVNEVVPGAFIGGVMSLLFDFGTVVKNHFQTFHGPFGGAGCIVSDLQGLFAFFDEYKVNPNIFSDPVIFALAHCLDASRGKSTSGDESGESDFGLERQVTFSNFFVKFIPRPLASFIPRGIFDEPVIMNNAGQFLEFCQTNGVTFDQNDFKSAMYRRYLLISVANDKFFTDPSRGSRTLKDELDSRVSEFGERGAKWSKLERCSVAAYQYYFDNKCSLEDAARYVGVQIGRASVAGAAASK